MSKEKARGLNPRRLGILAYLFNLFFDFNQQDFFFFGKFAASHCEAQLLVFVCQFDKFLVFHFLFFLFRFSSSGFLPFDVSNIYAFFIFEKKKIKLFFALVGAA